jgi:hypothetical protein
MGLGKSTPRYFVNAKRQQRSSENQSPTDSFADLALPKKVVAAIKNLPANTEREKLPSELVVSIKKAIDDIGWDYGPQYSRVFAPLFKRARDTFEGNSLIEQDRHIQEMLRSVVNDNPTFSSTVPIILESPDRRKAEQVGSGVLTRIVARVFLLTAAHVIDFDQKGTLLVPSRRGYIPITGKCTSTPMPPSGRRLDDEWDVAFVWLDDDCVSRLDSDYVTLDRPDVYLEGHVGRYDYTFAGFPWRKSSVRGRCIETNLTTMSGIEAKQSEYEALKLDPKFHIAMRFHRRRAFSHRLRKPIKSVLPDGMSGGGAYVWSEEALNTWPVRLPLAGIITDKVLEKDLLIATRLHVFIQLIFHQQPELAAVATG